MNKMIYRNLILNIFFFVYLFFSGVEAREKFEVFITEGVEAKRCGKFGKNCTTKGIKKQNNQIALSNFSPINSKYFVIEPEPKPRSRTHIFVVIFRKKQKPISQNWRQEMAFPLPWRTLELQEFGICVIGIIYTINFNILTSKLQNNPFIFLYISTKPFSYMIYIYI